MSQYYEFNINVLLEENKPDAVLRVLNAFQEIAAHGSVQTGIALPEHEFFVENIWDGTFGLESSFAGFPGRFFARVQRSYQFTKNGKDHEFDGFSMRAVIHDDCYGYHLMFLDWLVPHCYTQGFLGYEREELSPRPTLFYTYGGKLYHMKSEDNPVCLDSGREYDLD